MPTHTQDVLVTYVVVDEMLHRTFKVFLQSKVKNNSFILTTPLLTYLGPFLFVMQLVNGSFFRQVHFGKKRLKKKEKKNCLNNVVLVHHEE